MKNTKHDDLCQVSGSKVDYTGLLIEEINVGLEQKSLELHPSKCKTEKSQQEEGVKIGEREKIWHIWSQEPHGN